jgi:predicted DNA-binding protein YlxM (UPF0122 family)
MLKILNGFDWLEEEIGEETKEIKECIQKGLLKYTDDESRPQFIVLEKNIPAVKEILKDDYNRLTEKDFLEWLEFDFGGCYEGLEIKNIFGNEINVSMDVIIDLINEEEELYFNDEMKLEVYNAERPNTKLFDFLNIIGRDQARLQIQALLDNIGTQTFR